MVSAERVTLEELEGGGAGGKAGADEIYLTDGEGRARRFVAEGSDGPLQLRQPFAGGEARDADVREEDGAVERVADQAGNAFQEPAVELADGETVPDLEEDDLGEGAGEADLSVEAVGGGEDRPS